MTNSNSEGIDPAHIPYRILASGARIPVIGLGTFGSDKYRAHEIAHAVQDAAALGYRHFDCAAVYGNDVRRSRSTAAAGSATVDPFRRGQ